MAKLTPSKLMTLFLLGTVTAIGASAQTFKSLAQFNGQNGAKPDSALTQGPDGRLYGTTSSGSLQTNSLGTLFAMDTSGNLATLANFNDALNGATDYSPFSLVPSGALLGSGKQIFYEVTSNGRFRIVDQDLPYGEGALVQGVDGSVFGVTVFGGAPDCGYFGCGTAYKIDPQGHYHLLVTFPDGNNLYYPVGLTLGHDANLYGITSFSEEGELGHVFRMTPGGTLTVIYSFCSQQNCADGAYPSDIIQGSDGYLYGVTFNGGSQVCKSLEYQGGCGILFRLSLSGDYTVLHTFCRQLPCGDGAYPVWLIEGSDGALYGVTSVDGNATCNCGTIFRVAKGGHFTTLYQFQTGDGYNPAGIMQATSGLFYGVQNAGPGYECGDGFTNCGLIYSLDTGLAPFVSVVRDFGRLGQSDSIIGQGFAGATAVAFNGTPATFTVVSDTFLTTNVPQGATTGYVTVTTPTGVLKSNVPFRVIR